MPKYPPFLAPGAAATTAPLPTVAEPDYPPIDEFLDELPPIEEFLSAETQAEVEADAQESGEEEWITAGWQSYDFSGLSDLTQRAAPRTRPQLKTRERITPREAGSYSMHDPGPGAQEVADALDGIARRIRSGELTISNLHGTPPEAAMAAAMAALLRMRG
jgi:hypothetical protein